MPEYGLAAIARHNGWEMAFVGMLIVFTGLTLLAMGISRLHRVLDFWEKKKILMQRKKSGNGKAGRGFGRRRTLPEEEAFQGTPEFRSAYMQYALLKEGLPYPVSLPRLLDLAEKRGVPRCHAVLADLLRAGVLHSDGDGFYLWDASRLERIMASGRPGAGEGASA